MPEGALAQYDYLAQIKRVTLEGRWCGRYAALRFVVYNRNATAGPVLLLWRFCSLNGDILDYQSRITPNTDGSGVASNIPIGQGYLLEVIVQPASGFAPRYGECFVAVRLRDTTTNLSDATIIHDYVTVDYFPTWPAGRFNHQTSGQGKPKTVVGTNPAAGSEISQTVPTGVRWKLQGLRFSLVTDATVATRQVAVQITDGTNVILRYYAVETQIASLTRNYNCAPIGIDKVIQVPEIYITFPINWLLPAGYVIATTTVNLQGGDDYGAPVFLVNEWIEP